MWMSSGGDLRLPRTVGGWGWPRAGHWRRVVRERASRPRKGGPMSVPSLLNAARRRRSSVTLPGYLAGRPPRNKGLRYPPDPPTVEEIVAVMRQAGEAAHGARMRALIVLLWRAGLRINEALTVSEHDLEPRAGSVLVRHGKGGPAPRGRHRPVGLGATQPLARGAAAQGHPLVDALDGGRDGDEPDRDQPHLASLRSKAAPDRGFQALARPAVHRQGQRHRRAVPQPARRRGRAVRRREVADPGARPLSAGAAAHAGRARASHPRLTCATAPPTSTPLSMSPSDR